MKKLILIYLITIVLTIQTLQAKALHEYTIKAAYLYNFALLTQWSFSEENQTEAFNICFYQKDFGVASDILKEKTIDNKQIYLFNISSIEEASKCQVVFIRKKEKIDENKLAKIVAKGDVLVVTDNEEIQNSHITILVDKQKLAFTVNLKYIKETDLALSSHLLKLAKKVIQ